MLSKHNDGEYARKTIEVVIQGWSPGDLIDELHERFDTGRCTHAHDCCGHWYGGVKSVKHTAHHTLIVDVNYWRNI